MIEPFLQKQLEPVARRVRQFKLWQSLSLCWGIGALVGLLILLVGRWSGLAVGAILNVWLIATALVAFVLWRKNVQWRPDYREIAHRIEKQNPQLHALLITAIEQKPDPATGEFNFLQERVLQQAVLESRKQSWIESVPSSQMRRMQLAHLGSLFLLALLLINLRGAFGRISGSISAKVPNLRDTKVTVVPGNASVEKGSPLAILARVEGPLPPDVQLVMNLSLGATSAPADGARRVPLVKSLDDPVFAATLSEVASDFAYHLEYQGKRSPEFTIRTFEYPKLDRADVLINYPTYTHLVPKAIPDTRRVSAVEGSTVHVEFHLNKPVARAALIAKDRTEVPLTLSTNTALAVLNSFVLRTNVAMELRLVDAEGRTNKIASQFFFEAIPNRRPEIKIASPNGDQKVSPLEEITFRAETWDDFGLEGYGVSFHLPGSAEQIVGVTTNSAPNEKRTIAHLLRLELMHLDPGALVSWYMYADDVGPDGKIRRTTSDLFFAEVRAFEEIYRKAEGAESAGESKPEQQQESEKLLELQKQIVSASFKLQRQEAGKAGGPFAKDANVVKESQEKALGMVEGLLSQSEDPKIKPILEEVATHMKKAAEQLSQAADTPSVAPLTPALDAEQAAYQGLLKMQAREFQVRRSKSKSQGGQSADSQRQRQLDQLEMQDEKDRYETQKQAAAPKNPEQREQLQTLNRLKELAQRQQDINQQLKELQAALQAAQSEQEKEELQRRLKRLREEQQQMLSDVDELRQRMDRAKDPSSVAEAKKQLDQTRSEMQQAAEAMGKGQTSSALARGSRAQQNLQEAKEDFRKKTSNQFSEELRNLRNEARQLSQKQEEISTELQNLAQPKRKSLVDAEPKENIARELGQQKSSLTNLLDRMKQVSEAAEASEPNLSRHLYDTLRKTDQSKTETQLEMSAELLRRGFNSQANSASQQARNSLDQLKQGVERAAESILGDDTESLRQARKELEALGGQAEKELAQASGGQQSQPQNGSGRRAANGAQASSETATNRVGSASSSAASRPTDEQGQGQQGQGQQGQGQQGQGQQGQGQQGQGQQGQGQQGQGQQGQGQQGQGQQGQGQQGQGQQGQGQQGQGQQGQGQQGQGQQGQGQQGQGQQGQGQQGQGQQGQGQQGQGQQGQGQQGQGQQGQGQQGQGQQGQGQQGQGQQGQGQQGQGQQGQGQQGQGQQGQGQQGQGQQGQGQQGQGQGRGNPGQMQAAADPSKRVRGQNPGRQAQRQGQQGQGGSGGERANQNRQASNNFFSEDGAESNGPITGQDYSAWADRLRDVEEALDDPALKAKVAGAREQARQLRNDYKKHAKDPQWSLVKSKIIDPLAEVRQQVSQELAKRESKDSLVPIDRDPVPTQYSESVKRYYERLGSSK